MNFKTVTAIAVIAMATIACSEDTEGIGASLTSETDELDVSTGVFSATSRSIIADSVYAKNYECYLGLVKDPETGAYVKSEFMVQFNMLEDFTLPKKDQIVSLADGEIVADSCEITLFISHPKSYGDTLTAMKMRMTELETPVEATQRFYSNYDLKSHGYLREDGIAINQLFSMRDMTLTDSVRNLIQTNIANQGTSNDNNYYDQLHIRLNKPYTDQDGKTYSNYGSYLMNKYYDEPEYYSNSYRFVHKVCPGFYFEVTDGLGLMANFNDILLRTYFRYTVNDSTYTGYFALASTPEVLQTVTVSNDKDALQRLVDDGSCTYLKSPAGIFTEVTMPVDEITQSHATDSLLSVSIEFKRQNSLIESKEVHPLSAPANILMIQKDSLNSFFEAEKMYDFTSSYMASLSTTNSYSFSNIGNLITLMAQRKKEGLQSDPNWVENHPDWNKVVLVPIETTVSTDKTITAISNQMGLSSTKLVGGTNGSKIEMKVIYAKFRE